MASRGKAEVGIVRVIISGIASAAILAALLAVAAAGLAREPSGGAGGAGGPDFDGDGFADLAVGSPLEDVGAEADAGTVNVIYGSALGLAAARNQSWGQDSAGIRNSAESGDLFGQALAAADFNDDGFTDLAVGVPKEDLGGINNAGGVNVLYGSLAGLTEAGNQFWTQDKADVAGDAEPDDQFGWALAAGDFDDDGFADLVIGMPTEDVDIDKNAGAVNVLHGSAAGLRGEASQFWSQDSEGVSNWAEPGDLFGRALAVSDFDGDGFADLAVAAPYEDYRDQRDGLVHLLYGSPAGLTATGSQVWSQDSPGIEDEAYLREEFGLSLAGGDFDGDGFADLAVGVWFQDFCNICNEGAVNVIYGSAEGLTAAGNQFWTQASPGVADTRDPFDRFGHAFAAGDFDANGLTDLAIAAPREDLPSDTFLSDEGGVNVLYGSTGGLAANDEPYWTQDAPGILEEAQIGDLFGLAMGAADFDADGSADLAVGVRFEDVSGAGDAGGVNAIYGSPGGLTPAGNQFWSQDTPGILGVAEAGDHFGHALAIRSASGTPGESRPDYWESASASAIGRPESEDAGAAELIDATPLGPAPSAAPARESRLEIGGIGEGITAGSPSATLIVAGDIASCSYRADSATARLVDSIPGTVVTAGDNAYDLGRYSEFRDCYDPTWGRFLDRTRPTPGNHDWATPGADGYFRYFGDRAGAAGRGYYAFDVGTWRIYSLSTDCSDVGGCGRLSDQYAWLQADLASNPRACALGVWHHPRFSSGPHGSRRASRPFLKLLHRAGAEVAVASHDHIYERFARAGPDGEPDATYGIRQFVVGTGGGPLYAIGEPFAPNSRVRSNGAHGVLRLTLDVAGYAWEFVPVPGDTFTDAGQGVCHGPPPA